MTERRGFFTLALGIAALGIAVWAAGRGRELIAAGSPLGEPYSSGVATAAPAPIGTDGFWIGGWVGPPPALRDAAAWRDHAAAGLDVSMGPLEDRFRREDNRARLAFLDSLRSADGESTVPFVFVRDDSLHPDEATRPGWERRVEAIVRAYAGSRSLAGYFLADEPRLADSAGWAPAARLLRRLDPAHPAYVNFLPIAPEDAVNPEARTRWSNSIARTLATGWLRLFTFDAYPFPVGGGERPHFLATLRAAVDMSSRGGAIPFGAVLQWTGHGELRSATRTEALYQATQALAHGAAGITWFTWWTPNPAEEPWRWRDGAIAYDGTRTARADTLAAVNHRVRELAAARGPGPMRAVHVGGGLPPGLDRSLDAGESLPPEAPVARVTGGPATLGWTLATHPRAATRCLLANRDRTRAHTFTVTFRDGTTRTFAVQPGDAVVF